MSRILKAVIIKDGSSPTGVRVVYLAHGSTHNLQLRPAPPGFAPGDEKFMKFDGHKLSIDLEAHSASQLQQTVALHDGHTWNTDSPLERLRKKIKP